MKQVFNPYLPSYEYVPDGEPHVFGDRVYVYGSHEAFNGNGFCQLNYVCWSAPLDQLADWKYEGVIFDRLTDPLNANGRQFMNAPDVCQGVDGRFYLYYQLHMDKGVSVAVSDRPEGPFTFLGHVRHEDGTRYGFRKKDAFAFDPGVLVDDDNRVYLYTGFGLGKGGFRTLMKLRGCNVDSGFVVELEADMLTVKGKQYATIPGPIGAAGTEFEGHSFFEASSIRKIGDTYYLVYSSELSHELCYSTSKSPVGPFSYGGTLVSIGDIGLPGVTAETARNFTGNTHGGMVCINGNWYIFYHRQTNRQKCCRQGCAEPIVIAQDGSIRQAEMTSCGLNGNPLMGSGTYEARIACNLWGKDGTYAYIKVRHKENTYPYFTQSGEDREENGDQYIANMKDGATAGFKYFAFAGEDEISASVRGTGDGVFIVSGSADGPEIARIRLQPSEQWTTFSSDLKPMNGTSALFFRYEGSGSVDFNSFTMRNK